MSIKKAVAKFLVDTALRNGLISAGTQIGEAIGKKIGARIYQEPKPQPKSEEK